MISDTFTKIRHENINKVRREAKLQVENMESSLNRVRYNRIFL